MGGNCATSCKSKAQNLMDRGRDEIQKKRPKKKSINDLMNYIPTDTTQEQTRAS